ncbi:transmembrane protein 64-like isoform X2 [Watersipora subatra]|uniref:transmembrane protein 64-like isoform X2 n=1 Tax=Watersipora subatra TaxID=2589382 RepID=UPI00355BB4E2
MRQLFRNTVIATIVITMRQLFRNTVIAAIVITMRQLLRNTSYVERNYVMGAQARALLDVLSGRNGYKIVFLMRFTPIPFGLQNAIFAVSGIKSGPYLISSTLGLSFTQFAYSYMGSRFRSIAEVFNNDNSTTAWLLLSLQLSLMLILMVVVVVLAKQELDRNVREGDDDDCESLSTMQSKGIQTVNSPDKRCEFVTSKSRSHSRNMSVNIPPIVASGVHVV